jgi:hypothetical protein
MKSKSSTEKKRITKLLETYEDREFVDDRANEIMEDG